MLTTIGYWQRMTARRQNPPPIPVPVTKQEQIFVLNTITIQAMEVTRNIAELDKMRQRRRRVVMIAA
jgi:biopolymer transport protein ExbD